MDVVNQLNKHTRVQYSKRLFFFLLCTNCCRRRWILIFLFSSSLTLKCLTCDTVLYGLIVRALRLRESCWLTGICWIERSTAMEMQSQDICVLTDSRRLFNCCFRWAWRSVRAQSNNDGEWSIFKWKTPLLCHFSVFLCYALVSYSVAAFFKLASSTWWFTCAFRKEYTALWKWFGCSGTLFDMFAVSVVAINTFF